MGCKVILTPQSIDDLKEAVVFIAPHNPERARSFGNELIDRALTLATFPERGRVVSEIGEPAVREIIQAPTGSFTKSSRSKAWCMCSASGTARAASRTSKRSRDSCARTVAADVRRL